MKKVILVLALLVSSLATNTCKAEIGSLAEALADNENSNVFEKVATTAVALPISPIIGAFRGAGEKTAESMNRVSEADMNVVTKVLAVPLVVVYGISAGAMRGFFAGGANAVSHGFHEKAFSKKSFSLHDDWRNL